jgi:DNA-binding LacI/PurR family transcriptional regulator
MAITIKQVAAESGLSLMTVSYILNDKGHSFRPETRDRVLKAARKLGYRPNASARATRSGRFGCISLLMSTMPNRSAAFSIMMRSIHDRLAVHRLNLSLSWFDDEWLTSSACVPKILTEMMSDGLLINYFQQIPPALVELIGSNRIPSVWLNSRQGADCVCPDDLDAGARATQRLMEAGHRSISFVDCSASGHYSMGERYEGYARAMATAGLRPDLLRERTAIPMADRFDYLRAWLGRNGMPTGAVCYSDTTAGPLHAAALSLGLRVPDDLSIVTFAGSPAESSGFPLDTFVVPEGEVGSASVEMLIQKIADPLLRLPERSLAFAFAAGRSVAAPRA